VGANREEIVAGADQKDVLVVHAPEHHAAILKSADGHSLAEIWSVFVVVSCHRTTFRIVSERTGPIDFGPADGIVRI
jgi:hypothetical protein